MKNTARTLIFSITSQSWTGIITVYILKNIPGENRIEVLYSGSIKPVTNSGSTYKVTIRKISGDYIFLLNDKVFCQLNGVDLNGRNIGFSVPVKSEISVDYLKVDQLLNKTALAEAEREKHAAPGIGGKSPEITWISPTGQTTYLDSYSAKIKASVRSVSGLNGVLIYINGVSKGEPDVKNDPAEKGVFLIEKMLHFGPGENNVFIVANNLDGSARSQSRTFINPAASVPTVSWKNPSLQSSVAASASFNVEVCVKSTTGLKSIKMLVNGTSLHEDNVFTPANRDDCDFIWQKPVVLKEGDNNVFIVATNEAGTALSEERIIRYQPAMNEKRLALVIGNADYINKVSLRNPVNDANLMEATLKELGFDVIKQLNAVKDSMENAIRNFSRKLPNYNVALFYYAGHGLQVDGINYLIPADAELKEKIDCKFEALGVDFLTDEFKKHPSNINIVILDACRNNPYRSWVRGEEAGFKALAPIMGTIISFATSEGATSADGEYSNGLFTEELVKQMVISQPIESVFKSTRKRVIERSNGQQTPTEWSYLTGEFYFKR
ncbi:MAG: caspase family protein [Bacteroidales bacterium]|nr:caspase family protein [Bacteroidales bacterium]